MGTEEEGGAGLRVVELVLIVIRAQLREPLVEADGLLEVSHVVVAVGEERGRSTRVGELEHLRREHRDRFLVLLIADH